jgi:hypothetical protein
MEREMDSMSEVTVYMVGRGYIARRPSWPLYPAEWTRMRCAGTGRCWRSDETISRWLMFEIRVLVDFLGGPYTQHTDVHRIRLPDTI